MGRVPVVMEGVSVVMEGVGVVMKRGRCGNEARPKMAPARFKVVPASPTMAPR